MGQWYNASRLNYSSSPAFKDIEQPHIRFHELAGKALAAAKAGDMPEALRHLNALDQASSDTFKALERFASENPEAVQQQTHKVELF